MAQKLTESRAATLIYYLEDHCSDFRSPQQSIHDLRRLAARVFREHGVQPIPITAGRGLPHRGRLFSYFDWGYEPRIVLARSQRTRAVLLHELAHYIVGGGHGHSTRFRKKYFDLLAQYLRRDPATLLSHWLTLKRSRGW